MRTEGTASKPACMFLTLSSFVPWSEEAGVGGRPWRGRLGQVGRGASPDGQPGIKLALKQAKQEFTVDNRLTENYCAWNQHKRHDAPAFRKLKNIQRTDLFLSCLSKLFQTNSL